LALQDDALEDLDLEPEQREVTREWKTEGAERSTLAYG
jgi:hypothetical protein